MTDFYAGTLPNSQFWTDVAWNGTVFCAVGKAAAYFANAAGEPVGAYDPAGYISTKTTEAATSPDGITWTLRTLPNADWMGVAWNGTVFCAVAQLGSAEGAAAGPDAMAATSPDGITWTQRALPSANLNWSYITWNGSVFCAIDPSENVATSADGVTWAAHTIVPTGAELRTAIIGITSKGSELCALNATFSRVFTSTDNGVSWTTRTLPAGYYTDQGAYGIASNGAVYCIVKYADSVAHTSPDGVTWTARTLPSSSTWFKVAWDGTQFCAIANASDKAAVSPDGITWTAKTLPSAQGWQGLTAGAAGRFVAVADTAGAAASYGYTLPAAFWTANVGATEVLI